MTIQFRLRLNASKELHNLTRIISRGYQVTNQKSFFVDTFSILFVLMHHAVEVHEGIQIIKKSICKHYTACDWCESHREDFFIYTNFVL